MEPLEPKRRGQVPRLLHEPAVGGLIRSRSCFGAIVPSDARAGCSRTALLKYRAEPTDKSPDSSIAPEARRSNGSAPAGASWLPERPQALGRRDRHGASRSWAARRLHRRRVTTSAPTTMGRVFRTTTRSSRSRGTAATGCDQEPVMRSRLIVLVTVAALTAAVPAARRRVRGGLATARRRRGRIDRPGRREPSPTRASRSATPSAADRAAGSAAPRPTARRIPATPTGTHCSVSRTSNGPARPAIRPTTPRSERALRPGAAARSRRRCRDRAGWARSHSPGTASARRWLSAGRALPAVADERAHATA